MIRRNNISERKPPEKVIPRLVVSDLPVPNLVGYIGADGFEVLMVRFGDDREMHQLAPGDSSNGWTFLGGDPSMATMRNRDGVELELPIGTGFSEISSLLGASGGADGDGSGSAGSGADQPGSSSSSRGGRRGDTVSGGSSSKDDAKGGTGGSTAAGEALLRQVMAHPQGRSFLQQNPQYRTLILTNPQEAIRQYNQYVNSRR